MGPTFELEPMRQGRLTLGRFKVQVAVFVARSKPLWMSNRVACFAAGFTSGAMRHQRTMRILIRVLM